jgi:hypothetical protein
MGAPARESAEISGPASSCLKGDYQDWAMGHSHPVEIYRKTSQIYQFLFACAIAHFELAPIFLHRMP